MRVHPELHPGHKVPAKAEAKAETTRAAAGVPATAGFALIEPRLQGDYQQALLAFLLKHVKR